MHWRVKTGNVSSVSDWIIYLAEYVSFQADYMWKSESDQNFIYGKYRHFVKNTPVSLAA